MGGIWTVFVQRLESALQQRRFSPPLNPLLSRAGHIALLFAGIVLCAHVAIASAPAPVNDAVIANASPARLLSDYRLFVDAGARTPNARVTPYELNTALFADGTLKFRYVYVPEGVRAQYNADGVFNFPVGTVLVKTFAVAADMRQPTQNIRFIETRLLIRRQAGWVALPYVWNEDQTQARLSVVGAEVVISFTDEEGAAIALDWAVPNVNECRGCHARNGEITPIGPSARNLNRPSAPRQASDSFALVSDENQIQAWARMGLLDQAPSARDTPRVPDAYDLTSGPLEARARAYLDVNCAHCHNPAGPAHTSGLDLSWAQTDPTLWGVRKRPVAAGQGSGGYEFSIEPGHPERSILVHRMQSTDAGVMMPELGRQLRDERAIALMRAWIESMDENGSSAP